MKHKFRKGMLVGVICLLLLVSLPGVLSNEGKPDLIIEDIKVWPETMPYQYELRCTVKNIGDVAVTEENPVEIKVTVRRLLFGVLPLLKVYSDSTIWLGDYSIDPNESKDFIIVSCNSLPKFGWLRVYCTVNPQKTIDEEHYFNNHYAETFFVFLGKFIDK